VTFAGAVASTRAVSIDHGSEVVSTVSSLAEIDVVQGAWISSGDVIGTTDSAHAGSAPGVHLSVRVAGEYVDPAEFLTEFDVSAAIHLAPLATPLAVRVPSVFGSIAPDAGSYERPCVVIPPLESVPPLPPTDNIAVAVAGIGSSTKNGLDAEMYVHGPEELGYPDRRIYRFSYAGIDGPHLHEPYRSIDTFVDIDESARRLRDLLAEIARRHPGAGIDLIAHSQGGIVARSFLQAYGNDPGMPRVEHLVTFASPHSGAPLADVAVALDPELVGHLVMGVISRWARSGGPIPDPRSHAIRDLAPSSDLMGRLVRGSLPIGIRGAGLGIANDFVVPAATTAIPGGENHVVGPKGLIGHSAILTSPGARSIAYSALRDGPPVCRSGWDRWGPRVGRAIGWAERAVGGLVRII
jgi:hypothetical protein